jgi:hypothetical protein
MDLLEKLLEIIEDGNAPAIGNLDSNNVVDDYYQRLVEVIEKEKCIREGENSRKQKIILNYTCSCYESSEVCMKHGCVG